MSARQIIISSDIFQEERASYGTIWAYRLWFVLPPASDNGLCHWCLDLRNNIAWMHKEVPHTDPDSDEGKLPVNHQHHLYV